MGRKNKYNPFRSVDIFEEIIAEYAGSKYAVAVDSCSNAMFLSLMYVGVNGKDVYVPKRTYPSAVFAVMHAGGNVVFTDESWEGIYAFDPFPIIDGAKRFTSGMYEKGTYHCLSFHAAKHLKIGRGGAILTDNKDARDWFKLARFDGREEGFIPCEQEDFTVAGWNFYMTPEQASRGLWLMSTMPKYNKDLPNEPDYPDMSKMSIFKGEEK
ncbi:MAG: DegT/DnrJ/EryC1/StrS family aminotransferase [Candidatus Woesearchaeota archaeon]|nr:MAG: DegT/DnrJ/EryC1/StrS family aminotransferase [Candidatus Woesearchaeota archaeon]